MRIKYQQLNSDQRLAKLVGKTEQDRARQSSNNSPGSWESFCTNSPVSSPLYVGHPVILSHCLAPTIVPGTASTSNDCHCHTNGASMGHNGLTMWSSPALGSRLSCPTRDQCQDCEDQQYQVRQAGQDWTEDTHSWWEGGRNTP